MFVRFIKGSLFKRFPASRASQKAMGCPTAHGIHCTRPNRSGTSWLQRKLFQHDQDSFHHVPSLAKSFEILFM